MKTISSKDKSELICAGVALFSLVGEKVNWISIAAGAVILGFIGFKIWAVYDGRK